MKTCIDFSFFKNYVIPIRYPLGIMGKKTIVGKSSHYSIFRNACPSFWPPFPLWKWTHVWTKTWCHLYFFNSICLASIHKFLISSIQWPSNKGIKWGFQCGSLLWWVLPLALTMLLAKELGQEAQIFHPKEQSEGPGKIPSPT